MSIKELSSCIECIHMALIKTPLISTGTGQRFRVGITNSFADDSMVCPG